MGLKAEGMDLNLHSTALFGGSFDPPHRAHLAIAAAAMEQAGIGRIVFLPCRISPLKGRVPGATGQQRAAMLEAAAAELPGAEVSRWELERPGPSYSWQTAEHFAAQAGVGRLCWLLGADQWAQIDRWARVDRLAELVEFIVFGRDDLVPQPRPGMRAHFLRGLFQGSSTEVRRRCAAGEPISDLVAPGVEEIISREGLYR